MYIYYITEQLEILSARSWAAPVRAAGTERKRHAVWSVHHVQNKITPAESLSSSHPGWPPCWASPLAFGLIGVTCLGGEGGGEVVKLSNAKKSDLLYLLFLYHSRIFIPRIHVVWRCCAANSNTRLLSSLVNTSSNHAVAEINRQSHDQRGE